MLNWIWLAAASVVMDRPADIVDLRQVDASIKTSIRYATTQNFTGKNVPGYDKPRCLLTTPAANALAKVQQDLIAYGHSLLVYDCYRPQEAVDAFVAWANTQDIPDQRIRYYPTVPKAELFKQGYIAKRSGHSRASTVDLTIVPAVLTVTENAGSEDCRQGEKSRDDSLPMGTTFDCFDPLSHTASVVGPEARRNRLLLKSLMEKHGFKNYKAEWWHYTLRDEPYPKTYFGFPVD